MGVLRRVTDRQAGPAALGILVPPGPRTVLILRPRSLAFDFLLVGPDGTFRDMAHHEADAAAGELGRALDELAAQGPGATEAVPAPGGWWLRLRVGAFALLACPREPGRPYRPTVFADADAARAAAGQLAAVLCPPDGVAGELYFNTRHFGR